MLTLGDSIYQHCDVQGECRAAPYSSSNSTSSPSSPSSPSSRSLTCIFYLGFSSLPPDSTFHPPSSDSGGSLVLKSPSGSSQCTLPPTPNTLLIFNSKASRHRVLPLGPSGLHRYAITVWLYDAALPSPHAPVCSPLNAPPPPSAPASIFVTIPSLTDPEVHHTITSLFRQASSPASVTVALCLQASASSPPPPIPPDLAPRVKIITLDSSLATGPMLPRYLCQGLYSSEDYYLSVDSHTIFRRNWDSYLISEVSLPITGWARAKEKRSTTRCRAM